MKGKTITDRQRPADKATFQERFERFFERNRQPLFVISMALGVTLTILLFDVKMSLSGDDSDYLVFGQDFWQQFVFPGFRGPLYPIVLAPFIGIFGINLILLKSLSALFILASLWLLYLAFRDKIEAAVLLPSLLLVGICSYVFFYACHTYSEPLFMLTQASYIYFFAKYFLTDERPAYTLKSDWQKYLLLGVMALAMGLTRSIGYAVVGIAALYLLIDRRWKDALFTVVAAVAVFFIFQLLKGGIWPEAGSAYDIKNYLAKDYYNVNGGMEDLPGFMNRLKENSMIYLSSILCQFLGVTRELPSNYIDDSVFRTVLLYLLFAVSFVVTFHKNRSLLFVGLYVGVMNFFSFVLLQIIWAQDRLIMIYYPLILIFLLGGIYYLFRYEKLRRSFFIYPILLAVICFGTLSNTQKRVARNIPVLQQNMLGDQLYGLTPDWQNLIKASRWATKNLPAEATIVSRKPSISRVYTNRAFSWAPTEPTITLEEAHQRLRHESLTPFIVNAGNATQLQNQFMHYIIRMSEQGKPLVIGNQQTSMVFAYLIPDTLATSFTEMLNAIPTNHTTDIDAFFATNRDVPVRTYDIEKMYQSLLDAKIEYLLLAQLRIDPTQHTGHFIENVHRYVWYVSGKYPTAFELIHTEGTSEPCEIVKFRPAAE